MIEIVYPKLEVEKGHIVYHEYAVERPVYENDLGALKLERERKEEDDDRR